MMEFCKLGIKYIYYGDHMLWRWPWRREGLKKYQSSLYSLDFETKIEYWKHVGALEGAIRKFKVSSHSFEDIISGYIAIKYATEYVVYLSYINVSLKDSNFWLKIPTHYRNHFTKDVVVLHCKEPGQVYDLVNSIEPEFAIACGFIEGQQVVDNQYEHLSD